MSFYEWLTVSLGVITLIVNIVLTLKAKKRDSTISPKSKRARIERRKR